MRILKFIGVFLGTLILIFFIVFGFNLDALKTLYNNSGDLQEGQQWVSKATSLKGLTQYIGSNPQHTTIVSRSITNPDTAIAYGADKPRTMGTISNFFLITTYARLVEDGKIDPDELIPVDRTNRYQLPYIDESHHDDAKSALKNKGAVNKNGKVPLDELLQTAIIYNDLAISDFLYYKLGQQAIEETYKLLELKSTDLPLPFSGLYITLHPDLNNSKFDAHFETLSKLPQDEFSNKVLRNTERFRTDNEYHAQVTELFKENQGLGIGFKERRNMLSLFPKSTGQELTEIMIQLEQNELISAPVSERVKGIMDWPYQEQGLNNDFKYYGALYDNRLGLLNGIDYGASVYSEEPFGQAIFFDSLQVAFWFHMSSNLMHQDYQQRLMWDPALREATLQEISK
ncbi:serine hydrolase [Fodinibius sp. AD559]|uniref:serine hydrolase n=1 Tax=Fodinibius sp. AD559 TaxID=3424179 RepID=UPI004046ABA2